MKLIIIVAVANNNVIGGDNKLLWHMPADLKKFKETTMGHTMIMGRKTFESIGKPLPGRKTIVVTGQKDFDAKGCEIASSFEEAISMVKNEEKVFVTGGAEIYQKALDSYYTKNILITRIYADFEGDTFFPDIDSEKWELIDIVEHKPDEKNKYPYAFLTYKRKVKKTPKV